MRDSILTKMKYTYVTYHFFVHAWDTLEESHTPFPKLSAQNLLRDFAQPVQIMTVLYE
jgi:hypothetical protein